MYATGPGKRPFNMSEKSNAVSLVLDVLKERRVDRGVIGMELSADIHVHMAHTPFHFHPSGPTACQDCGCK